MLNGVLGSILMLLMLFLGNKVEKLCGLCNITLNKTAVFGDTSASAINLVISLYLRSNLKDPGGNVLDERSGHFNISMGDLCPEVTDAALFAFFLGIFYLLRC
ncbi:uncharacterized protein LOC104585111 isoform X5 [Brachypodium distachyon]|uniref:uncharacterized protein LOC104585111 isoform X5 n=1 Tax=Brachypodium distachyon TaxID=15368 RepID=UPI000D0CBBCC|nr:uncharacterized protein LOC104585111 isoform X5 [Brachypodium distachyon]|eukprot:XP_024318620.1 uncharacterized protein LOC104585111 isoform X5 [Brachypodium distachyon]